MKKLLTLLAAGAFVLGSGAVLAHGGDKPKHGGIVQAASELSFELAQQDDGVTLYVEDHGKPLATTGMSGKLTVLKGSEKSETQLTPAGDNKLEAKGVKLVGGSKAVATLNTGSKKAITVRFNVR